MRENFAPEVFFPDEMANGGAKSAPANKARRGSFVAMPPMGPSPPSSSTSSPRVTVFSDLANPATLSRPQSTPVREDDPKSFLPGRMAPASRRRGRQSSISMESTTPKQANFAFTASSSASASANSTSSSSTSIVPESQTTQQQAPASKWRKMSHPAPMVEDIEGFVPVIKEKAMEKPCAVTIEEVEDCEMHPPPSPPIVDKTATTKASASSSAWTSPWTHASPMASSEPILEAIPVRTPTPPAPAPDPPEVAPAPTSAPSPPPSTPSSAKATKKGGKAKTRAAKAAAAQKKPTAADTKPSSSDAIEPSSTNAVASDPTVAAGTTAAAVKDDPVEVNVINSTMLASGLTFDDVGDRYPVGVRSGNPAFGAAARRNGEGVFGRQRSMSTSSTTTTSPPPPPQQQQQPGSAEDLWSRAVTTGANLESAFGFDVPRGAGERGRARAATFVQGSSGVLGARGQGSSSTAASKKTVRFVESVGHDAAPIQPQQSPEVVVVESLPAIWMPKRSYDDEDDEEDEGDGGFGGVDAELAAALMFGDLTNERDPGARSSSKDRKGKGKAREVPVLDDVRGPPDELAAPIAPYLFSVGADSSRGNWWAAGD
jgi:hypothetical protein